MQNENIELGDYVLATKWHDGSVSDHWCVGFYAGTLPKVNGDRFLVENDQGHSFRSNGFRTVQKITANEGKTLLEVAPPLEGGDECLFDILEDIRTGVGKD